MTTNQLKTKAEEILEIKTQIIRDFLGYSKTGVINPKDFRLVRAESRIRKLKDGLANPSDFVDLYSTLGLIALAKGKVAEAVNLHSNAMKLNPSHYDNFCNHCNVLSKGSYFQEVENIILEQLIAGSTNYELLVHLYNSGLRNLNFDAFQKYFEKVCNSKKLTGEVRVNLERLYKLSKNFGDLPKDLADVNIDISTFSEFFDILNIFHSENLHDHLNVSLSIENVDEQYLIVEVYADISLEEALKLTNEIETRLVEYSIETGNKNILSKFLVYYKNYEMFEGDETPQGDYYLGMNEELVV